MDENAHPGGAGDGDRTTVVKSDDESSQHREEYVPHRRPAGINSGIDLGLDLLIDPKKKPPERPSSGQSGQTGQTGRLPPVRRRAEEPGRPQPARAQAPPPRRPVFASRSEPSEGSGEGSDEFEPGDGSMEMGSEQDYLSGSGLDEGMSDVEGGSGLLDPSELEGLDDDGSQAGMEGPPRAAPRAKMSIEEVNRLKRDYYAKLERLRGLGYEGPRRLNLTATLDELKDEYEHLDGQRRLDSSIKFQRKVLMGAVTGIEWLNHNYNPFDFHLDGWSESVYENQAEYDEVFEELYEKYKESVKMAPELRLVFMVLGSAMMFHFSKALFSNASAKVPGFDQVMNSNPELKRAYQEAAAREMGKGGENKNTGSGQLGGLLGNLTNNPMLGGIFGNLLGSMQGGLPGMQGGLPGMQGGHPGMQGGAPGAMPGQSVRPMPSVPSMPPTSKPATRKFEEREMHASAELDQLLGDLGVPSGPTAPRGSQPPRPAADQASVRSGGSNVSDELREIKMQVNKRNGRRAVSLN